MDSDTNGPNVDIRLLDRLEAHLESSELLGVDVGDGRAALDLLARLPMDAVEQLVSSPLSDDDRGRVLALVEHRKGQLARHELPDSEARERQDALGAMKRNADEHRKMRTKDR